MAGLVPAIHALDAGAPSGSVARMHGGWVYIMTNRPNGTLVPWMAGTSPAMTLRRTRVML
jgi:hypothetical protein